MLADLFVLATISFTKKEYGKFGVTWLSSLSTLPRALYLKSCILIVLLLAYSWELIQEKHQRWVTQWPPYSILKVSVIWPFWMWFETLRLLIPVRYEFLQSIRLLWKLIWRFCHHSLMGYTFCSCSVLEIRCNLLETIVKKIQRVWIFLIQEVVAWKHSSCQCEALSQW